jgi:hypothetical protein
MSSRLHCITSQKITLFIVSTAVTSNLSFIITFTSACHLNDWSRVLLEKLIAAQLSNNFPTF